MMQNELVILGGGESGVGAALLAKARGIDVFVSDKGILSDHYRDELIQNDIAFEEGCHSQSRILQAAEVVKSPGIPESTPLIMALKERGIPVISDIELAGRYSKSRMIGITGSNGKTTTTMWLHHTLKKAGVDAVLAGNVGVSPCRTLARRDPQCFVIELSSFQLDVMFQFRCNTAILTNITPDHLDRYDYKFQNYINAKLRILQNQTPDDIFIYGGDDPVLKANLKEVKPVSQWLSFSASNDAAAKVQGENMVLSFKGVTLVMPVADISLKGRHNLYNAMAVGLAALSMGLTPADVRAGLMSFQGVEHRLEPAGVINGVTYINDSKATNIDSTWYALESMTKPVIWIAGGTDKGNDYSTLLDMVRQKVKALVCMGVDNSKLVSAFTGEVSNVADTASLDEAMKEASRLAEPGDVVLLSPACASFDLFNNYEHRGQLFKTWVLNNAKELK
jgi:UDP-N-acetylmuramoylalanine--D-glutamate ligase